MNCRVEFESEEAFASYMADASEIEAAGAMILVRELFDSFKWKGQLGKRTCARMDALIRLGEDVFERRFGYLPLPF